MPSAQLEVIRQPDGTPFLKENVAVGANADIFTDGTVPGNGVLLIRFATNTPTIFKLKITRGSESRISSFEDGVLIVADAWQAWFFPVVVGEKLNFQVSVSATIWLAVMFQQTG